MQSGLLHLSLRFRRFLAMALSAHVLVTAVITALAACNPVVDATVTQTRQTPSAVVAAHHADLPTDPHAGHDVAVSTAPSQHIGHGVSFTSSPTPSESAPSHHHGSTTVTCPMSMACAVSAIASHVPAINTEHTYASSRRVLVNDSLPRSPRVAPEPPPPRA